MRRCMQNPAAGDGGASERLACRLDASDNNQNRGALQDSAEIDEILFRLGEALRLGRLDGWGRDFVASILGQAKRGRRRWHPSEKQLHTMRRLVAELTVPDTGPLIDDGGGDDWAA